MNITSIMIKQSMTTVIIKNLEYSNLIVRNFAIAAVAIKKTHKRVSPLQKSQDFLITCKKPELNLKFNHAIKNRVAKFGDISLASKGWKNRKSKNDYFIIHPQAEHPNPFKHEISELQSIVDPIILENLKNEFEITKITEIQMNSIQKIANLNHVLIAAETGCGKTLAYLIPIVDQILKRKPNVTKRDLNRPLGLILTPGRELATQISQVAEKLLKNTGLQIKTILGGNTKQKMINPDFEEVDLLIGTIGALSKLVTTGIYRMGHVRHVVLDEADTMLDDSFSDKLCYFLSKFPLHQNHLVDINPQVNGTQLILTSATMPTNINELLMKVINVETIHQVLSPNLHQLLPNVQQKFFRMNKSDRPAQLLTLIKSEVQKNRPTIIFSNKSETSDFVSIFLNNSGVNCLNLNGDMLMKIRSGRFDQFQNGDVDVLSTTDIGSRGLDTKRVRNVINFDFPLYVADYIHRCGRVGRLGSYENNLITNFVSSQREIPMVQKIEHTARTSGLLPSVNGNITNIIQTRILKDINKEIKNMI